MQYYRHVFFFFFHGKRVEYVWNSNPCNITEIQYKTHLFLALYFSNVEKVTK